MDSIKFSCNWNGKLNNTFFTTIRASRPSRIIEGRDYEIWLNNQFLFTAEIKKVHTLKLGEITPEWIMIDTGYSYTESLKIFANFFHCATPEQAKQETVDHILLQRVKKPGTGQIQFNI